MTSLQKQRDVTVLGLVSREDLQTASILHCLRTLVNFVPESFAELKSHVSLLSCSRGEDAQILSSVNELQQKIQHTPKNFGRRKFVDLPDSMFSME